MSRRPPVTLAATQRWFAAAVTRSTPPASVATAGRIAGDPALGPDARLGIYRFAYRERLRGVLAIDFPAVAQRVGDDAFAQLASAYARAFPSQHPNLSRYGSRFPDFLARQRAVRIGRAVIELARLELAIALAVAAEQRPTLTLASVAGLTARQQGRVRLDLQPSVQLLEGRFAVTAAYDAWEQSGTLPPARPVASWTCVHRLGWQVQRISLERRQFAVLRLLAGGAPLAAALRAAGDTAPLAAWFAQWASRGLFAERVNAVLPLARGARPTDRE